MPASSSPQKKELPPPPDVFPPRHIGPSADEIAAMLELLSYPSLEVLAESAIPGAIRLKRHLRLGPSRSENDVLKELRRIAAQNQVFRSYIGMGYYDCVTPPVIQRNVLENPGWYTAYTPYQPEIAQGRLEALLNFQTAVMDLTGMDVANASLLDEGTAAAEAMALSYNAQLQHLMDHQEISRSFFVSQDCHPQTIAVIRTRAEAMGFSIIVGDHESFDFFEHKVFGALVQYPKTDGGISDYRVFCQRAHDCKALVTVAADLLALTLLKSPAEFGADVVVGSAQRFGVPLGFGGPHAAFLATKQDFKRLMPGRIVGVSKDAAGKAALRLVLQTREQHIRREKATSNICTAQVLLAVMAGLYAVYHGPDGLKAIAGRIHALAAILAQGLRRLGFAVGEEPFFDTVRVAVEADQLAGVVASALDRRINLRVLGTETLTISLDETTGVQDVIDLLLVFAGRGDADFTAEQLACEVACASPDYWAAYGAQLLPGVVCELPEPFRRQSAYLTHPVFHEHRTETEMLRYLKRLESRDLSLTTSMIALGSCTMKLNATTEMLPVTWPEFSRIHPFAPEEQTRGYRELFGQLEEWIKEITGFAAVSLQPNAGSQGEFAGLLVIRKYHASRGEVHRAICLIPESAHGTNPASAIMAGMRVIPVACVKGGDIDVADLEAKAREHSENLAALMVTYPSTHGVFEEGIREVCDIVHSHGGLVYMDGANMNAQVGLCQPAEMGADVCHLNLHKTFCIPHGGGGPGMGPIAVSRALAPFLPGHPVVELSPGAPDGLDPIGPVSSAPWGSASILPISWAYIALMGEKGLSNATRVAILNANYVAKRLGERYPILFRGRGGLVAHECVLDFGHLKKDADITAEDVAKRLMDYGFHAPTVSWPVPNAVMVEPTESESKAELDRFCWAMMAIHEEAREIAEGRADKANNVLKNAPHTALAVSADKWDRPYSREKAAFPAPWTREHKFWPSVGRIDSAYGDRNFVCSCQ